MSRERERNLTAGKAVALEFFRKHEFSADITEMDEIEEIDLVNLRDALEAIIPSYKYGKYAVCNNNHREEAFDLTAAKLTAMYWRFNVLGHDIDFVDVKNITDEAIINMRDDLCEFINGNYADIVSGGESNDSV